jgi:hypothetical protein
MRRQKKKTRFIAERRLQFRFPRTVIYCRQLRRSVPLKIPQPTLIPKRPCGTKGKGTPSLRNTKERRKPSPTQRKAIKLETK